VRNEFRQVDRLRGMKCFPGGETQFVGYYDDQQVTSVNRDGSVMSRAGVRRSTWYTKVC